MSNPQDSYDTFQDLPRFSQESFGEMFDLREVDAEILRDHISKTFYLHGMVDTLFRIIERGTQYEVEKENGEIRVMVEFPKEFWDQCNTLAQANIQVLDSFENLLDNIPQRNTTDILLERLRNAGPTEASSVVRELFDSLSTARHAWSDNIDALAAAFGRLAESRVPGEGTPIDSQYVEEIEEVEEFDA